MISAPDELVSPSSTTESDSGDVESDSNTSTSSVIPVSETGVIIESIANLSVSNNAEAESGTSTFSVIPASEPGATIESTASLSLSSNAECNCDTSTSSVIPVSEPKSTFESTANFSLSSNAESNSGTSASSMTPAFDLDGIIESTANLSSNAESDSGTSTSFVIPASEPEATIESTADLSLSDTAESDSDASASSVIPASKTGLTIESTANYLFGCDTSKASINDAHKPVIGTSALSTPPLLEAKDSTEAIAPPSLFGSDTSKTSMFAAPKSIFGASASYKMPLSEAKPSIEATSPPSLFGSDTSKSSMFAAPKSVFGTSATYTTSLSEAKLSTEATSPSSLFGSDTSKAPMFAAPKSVFRASASYTTPLSEAKPSTEATSSSNLFGSETSKASMFAAPKSVFGTSATYTTSLSEAKPSTEATSSSSLFGSDTSKASMFAAPQSVFGASATYTTSLSEAKPSTEATSSSSLFGSDMSKAFMFAAPKFVFGASYTTPLFEAKPSIEAISLSSSIPAPHNSFKQPSPLTFHNMHCRGIRVSEDGSKVTRRDAECGMVYSARPINIYEKVCLRFLEVSDTSSSITAGFTNCDPMTPKSSSTLEWSRSLKADFCTKGTLFMYYVSPTGEVHFEINGIYRGILIEEVDTSYSLWMRLYINKFGTELELLDPLNLAQGETMVSQMDSKNNVLSFDGLRAPFPSGLIPLHKTKSTNVQTNEFGEAARLNSEKKFGYVFIAHPIKVYTMYIQILQTETDYSGSLAIGVTSCNPENLKLSELPGNPTLLLCEPGYWAVSSNVAKDMKPGDYLEVNFTASGEVLVGRNGSPTERIMRVNNCVPLWIFLNVFGATQKIRLLYRFTSLEPHTSLYIYTLQRWPRLTFYSDPDMKDIRVSKDGFKVITLDTKCGSVYSARPVNINEKVWLRFLEVNGFDPKFMAGFMNRDPMSLTWESVKNWNFHLKPEFCTKGSILSYSVDSAGVVSFEINGTYRGIAFSGVDTNSHLWVYLNISKTDTVVQFVDPRNLAREETTKPRRKLRRIIRPEIFTLIVDNCPKPFLSETLPIHKSKSHNVQTNEFGEAARLNFKISHGYVFMAHPIQSSYTMYIQILQTEGTITTQTYSGSLAIGVTSWDPANLSLSKLPECSERLLNRPEYWAVRCDVAKGMKRGDYLEVTLRASGEFQVGRNGSRPLTVMRVNNFIPLWLFVNIYGATQKIRLLKRPNPLALERPPRLTFHQEHSEGIRIHKDGVTVIKLDVLDYGLAYSARPVEANEKICLRFLETHQNPSITIGFVNRWAFNSVKEWNKILEPEICSIGTTFSYHFDTAGIVHFEVNGEYKGIWFKRVDPKISRLAYIDINSPSIVMQFVNPYDLVKKQRIIVDDSPIPMRPNSTPVNLHSTKGRNVRTYVNGKAERMDPHYCHGYVFTAQPIEIGQTILIQILETDSAYTRTLAIGLTSRDPATVDPNDLPEDSNILSDRPEYLVVKNNKTMNDIKRSDEMALTVTLNREVQLDRNGKPIRVLQRVDLSIPLWVFVDVYGATRKVRLLTTQLPLGNPLTQLGVSGVSPTIRSTVPSLTATENTKTLRIDSKRPDPSTSGSQELAKVDQLLMAGGTPVGAECIICKEEPVNSVLYPCGHMWMCLKCARKQRRGESNGRCATCSERRDAISTYK